MKYYVLYCKQNEHYGRELGTVYAPSHDEAREEAAKRFKGVEFFVDRCQPKDKKRRKRHTEAQQQSLESAMKCLGV
jgi:hypothetical protein